MCLYTIATEYNESPEAAYAFIDDDDYNINKSGAVDKTKLNVSDKLRG